VMFEGSGVIKILLSSSWWCSSWLGLNRSVLLRPLLWWHRELFFDSNTVGANVGGSENRMESPNTRAKSPSHKSCERETKNLQKPVLASKVVDPFTRALAPPFIGRWRDFLHSENTLESREYS
jgi:hypothetical protein